MACILKEKEVNEMQDIAVLVEKFLIRTLSKKERDQLKKWVLKDTKNREAFKNRIREHSRNATSHPFDGQKALGQFLETVDQKNKKSTFSRIAWRYAAVFVGLVVSGYAANLYLSRQDTVSPVVDVEHNAERESVRITLGDGTEQILSTNGDKVLANKDGRTVARRSPKSLDFRDVDPEARIFSALHTIYVPFGQTFNLTLSDGTKVWLNAGSSLKFPHFFVPSAQRTVFLSGEGFFDVAKDAERPFVVNAENVDVKVLGTRFNISAYEGEDTITATLVEGAVKVYEDSSPNENLLLDPDHQAAFAKANSTFKVKEVDARLYTSWMRNTLIIDHLSFRQILDKLERTHNVTIVNTVERLNSERFVGEFDNDTLDNILATIASSTPFTFERNNGIITIKE
ncbi:MAG: FecR domain-containing protein [Bacteroidota bacterium]